LKHENNCPQQDFNADLDDRFRFEALLIELSAQLVGVTFDSINDEIVDAQRRIVQELDLDRSTLAQLEGGDRFVLTHTWHLPGMEPFPSFAIKDLPWLSSAMLRGEVVSFARIDDLPPEAVREKKAARRFGPRSNVTFPLKVGGRVIGAMAFGTVYREREWPQAIVNQLQVFVEMIGSAIARTDAERSIKESEAILSSFSGRLIEAQEQERGRIARELHDDIGQRLALLGIGLSQAQQSLPESAELYDQIDELRERTTQIASDVQSMSHELHSSRLQLMGLAPAMRAFCQEFSEQQKVKIHLEGDDLQGPISPDTSLCFFRILQETLSNAAKHSGTKQFDVRLWGTPTEVHLMVSDSGSGFNTGVAKVGRGLGLISMHERLKILNGTLSIESQPQQGTTIHASVPINPAPFDADSLAADA
jgi:signal transduction histidine kinase